MTVLVGRRESFNAAHQLSDPHLSDDENRRGRRTVPFEVVGINPPRDVAFQVLAQ